MATRWRGRPSRRDAIELRNAQHRWYGLMSIKPNGPEIAERLCTPLPPKRERVKRPVDGQPAAPLEKEVLADVAEALRNDQRVWFVDRRQSGVFQEGNRYIRVGRRGVLDLSGMLQGGRYFEIECKRRGEKLTPDQVQRMNHVRAGGGISGVCWDVESALALLP